MSLEKIFDDVKGFEIVEMRCNTKDYREFVVFEKDLFLWEQVLNQFFDSPSSSSGDLPTSEDLDLTSDFGGLWQEQILYRKITSQGIVMVMLWPWKDKKHITVRMAQVFY